MKKIHLLSLLICIITICVIACKKNHKNDPIDNKPPNEVHIGDSVKVNFPTGSINSTLVSIKKSDISADDKNITSTMFDVSSFIPYQVVLNIGKEAPLSDSILLKIKLPDAFVQKRKSDEGFQLFAQLYETGGEETLDYFTLINSSYNPDEKTINAYLLADYFTKERNPDGTYEIIFTVGITPRENDLNNTSPSKKTSEILKTRLDASGLTVCDARQISCPLGHVEDCIVTSAFQPARIHPVTGQPKKHRGTDFRAEVGTSVYAVDDGQIKASGYQVKMENGKVTGWGNYVMVQHASYISIYAHLSEVVIKSGTVKRGQLIARSGNSGGVDHAHLHLEIIPGKLFKVGAQINPAPCLSEGNIDGNITVRDNGNIADDAFELYLNDILLGSTAIGQPNSIAAFGLLPGTKKLTLKCIVAPDNEGTYEIILNSGLTFLNDGGVIKSGVIAEGASVSWQINIPENTVKTNNINLAKPNAFKERGIN